MTRRELAEAIVGMVFIGALVMALMALLASGYVILERWLS